MNLNSRTSNVIRNIIGGVGGQIFTSLLTFVCRTYFIRLLGAEYLGVNGLFANILSMLSLAELGIGPAIVFSMYKPIANNDELHIAKLMNFYKSAYRLVAIVVASIGLILVPFLDHLIKDTAGVEHMEIIFMLILSNTVVSYFYAYKGSMLNADQKGYIVVIIRNIFAVVQNIVQIIILLLTGSFMLYLIVQIITTFIGNLCQAVYVDKKYPFLTQYRSKSIDKTERRDIMKRVRGMMMHKLGGFVLNGTDNLILSKFVGLAAVGIYSNYSMIITMVKTYVTFFSSGISAGVGNLIAKETKEKSYNVFKSIFLVYFWIYALCFICFWVLFKPFIQWWIGNDYLLGNMTLFVILLNFYCNGVQECINTFTNATGLFWETRHKPIAECIINLGVSIILADKIGISGVFIGTMVSFICTFWINPIVIYKKQFNEKVIRYFIRFAVYMLLAVVIAVGMERLCCVVSTDATILNILFRCVMSAVVPNVIFILLFFKTKEFGYCAALVKNIIKKRGK